MRKIQIEKEIKTSCEFLRLGCISAKVEMKEQNPAFEEYLNPLLEKWSAEINREAIQRNSPIQSSREAYKRLGKEPSRYRLSAEALMRRVAQGKGIYRINTLVDFLNSISLRYGFSIGGYDENAISGDINLGIGRVGEPYEAIGRGELNISYLPILRDEQGAFGTPTSDSTRTMVQADTSQFLMIIYSFGLEEPLEEAMQESIHGLKAYTNASDANSWIIG